MSDNLKDHADYQIQIDQSESTFMMKLGKHSLETFLSIQKKML